jgi:curli biogenesis system outer membrane secretion channel CsgG
VRRPSTRKEKTTGTTAQEKLTGVRYIFEGTVSEFNPEKASNDGSLTVGGMTVGRGNKRAEIGLDVRVVDVDSGLVVDAVNLRKPLGGGTTSVTGAGTLASNVGEMVTGKRIPLEPDVSAQASRRDGVDRALRACIEAALAELIERLDEE